LKQVRNTARNTQLQGASLPLWTRRIPRPWQCVHDAFASPIEFDLLHCMMRMSSCGASLCEGGQRQQLVQI
jgi:hypothetical protein